MSSVKSAAEDYLYAKRNLRYRTYRWYNQKLNVFTQWCTEQDIDLENVKAKTIQQFLDTLTTQSDQTRKGYVQVVRGFLSWCSKDEDYEDDVKTKTVQRIELPKVEKSVIHTFTTDEIRSLFIAIEAEDTPAQRSRAKALISIMLDTGVRASELVYDSARPQENTGLRIPMIDYGTHGPHIVVYGKGNKQRELPLGDRSRRSLKQYVERYRGTNKGEYVFLSRNDEPYTVRGLEQLCSRLAGRARVQDCHPHKFRHTFAVTYLLDSGKEINKRVNPRLLRWIDFSRSNKD